MAKRIRVIVQDGLVQDVENIPIGMEVVVARYDTDGADENLQTDEDGERSVEVVYQAEAGSVPTGQKLAQIDIGKLGGFEGGRFVELSEAVDIVLDLARQNVIDDPDMAEDAERQSAAIGTVNDFFVNNVFDGTAGESESFSTNEIDGSNPGGADNAQ